MEVICSLTFVIMFLPKKRQRIALGKDDLYENIASNLMKRIKFPDAYRTREKDRGGYRTGQGVMQDRDRVRYVTGQGERRQVAREGNKDTGQRTHRLKPVNRGKQYCVEFITN